MIIFSQRHAIVPPQLWKYAIGRNGNRINEARRIQYITDIICDEESNMFTIYGRTEEAVLTALSKIEVLEEIIPIPRNLTSKVIGTKGTTINSIVTESGVIRAEIINVSKIMNFLSYCYNDV